MSAISIILCNPFWQFAKCNLKKPQTTLFSTCQAVEEWQDSEPSRASASSLYKAYRRPGISLSLGKPRPSIKFTSCSHALTISEQDALPHGVQTRTWKVLNSLEICTWLVTNIRLREIYFKNYHRILRKNLISQVSWFVAKHRSSWFPCSFPSFSWGVANTCTHPRTLWALGS